MPEAKAWDGYDSIAEFFKVELEDSLSDIASHGADGGYPYITYYSDTVALYDKYEVEIMGALSEEAESLGYENTSAMIAGFNRADDADTPTGRKNLLVWYMAEKVALEVEDA